MEIEIAIEGPVRALSELSRRLVLMRPPMKNPETFRTGREGKARIVLKGTDKDLDENLFRISGAIRRVERILSLPDRLEIRVRNLAYSEPVAGGAYRTPFKPGSTITIVPWGPAASSCDEARTIVIDPRDAFGTGRHPSSRLCLRYLEDMAGAGDSGGRLKGKRVLDFGCGTGLLAIAAVKMGAQSALGVELDPRSARTAERNAALNGVSAKVTVRQGSWASVPDRYDLILANVVPSVLLRTGRQIPIHLADRGEALVSGFGEKRTGEVRAFFEALGLGFGREYKMEGWGAAVFVKA